MNKENIMIWGRAFQLNVCLECYPGETVLDSQKDALALLVREPTSIEAAKKAVEEYVVADNKRSFPDGKIDNIFKYVMPTSIFVPHDKNHLVAAILCNYKFDMEHGLAIVFEDGKYQTVGAQDIIL